MLAKAVIFDLDGVLFDSEPLQSESFKLTLNEYGISPDETHGLVQQLGLTARDNFLILKEKYRIEISMDELLHRKKMHYHALLRKGVVPNPNAEELLTKLRDFKLPLALATSSIRETAELSLNAIGLIRFFDTIISGDEISKPKPAPDIFEKASVRLHTVPHECMVIEDSPMGIRGAVAAKMAVTALRHQFNQSEDFSSADFVITDLIEAYAILTQPPGISCKQN